MNKDRNLNHEFLDLRSDGQSDRTFMGGMRLSARTRLFFLTGLAAVVGFAALYLTVDHRLSSALDDWMAAERLAGLAATVETGILGARAEEKRFLLAKDPAIAQDFKRRLDAATGALDRLAGMPESVPVQKDIATVRDGLAQYDQQFGKLVASEKALGLSDGTGLSRQLKDATEDLQAKFSTAGYANLAGQVARINQEGQETLLSGYKKGVEEIRKRYQTLITFLKETKIPAKKKAELQDLLKRHETSLLAMINARFSFLDETRSFDDIVAYLAPSTGSLTGFAGAQREKAANAVAAQRRFARIVVGAGSAVLVMALIAVGLLVMGSVNASVRGLAAAAGRLADGDRGVSLPARGNSDAVGTIARALDKWLDNLADLDHLRQELDHTRARLETTLAEAATDAVAAAEAARAALLADESDERTSVATGPESLPSRYAFPAGADDAGLPAGGPISSVSRQLASFSQYVTAAANDVERTEALIKGLDDATGQVEDMGSLVTAIRDQTNLLAFRSGPREPGTDNLVILSGEDRKPGPDSGLSDAEMASRFDAIRDATDRAERTAQSARNTLADVTQMAQEIAATASEQALEATHKLLSQSEYLQNMLDDVISKIHPAAPGEITDKDSAAEKPKSKKKKDEPPPKKA